MWAIVEVMGHRKYAGEVAEESLAGAAMLRVRVPGHTSESVSTEYRLPDGTPVTGSMPWEQREHAIEGRRPVAVAYPPFEVLLGGAALFAVHPSTEERVRARLPECQKSEEPPMRTLGEWAPVSERPMLVDSRLGDDTTDGHHDDDGYDNGDEP